MKINSIHVEELVNKITHSSNLKLTDDHKTLLLFEEYCLTTSFSFEPHPSL